MRELLITLSMELTELETRIAAISRQISRQTQLDPAWPCASPVTSIPGIGKVSATAILAAVGDGKQLSKARDMAAWLGLVPAQYSTGGKSTLLGISKRGNPYVRRLLVHGARSFLLHLDRTKNSLGQWISALETRMHTNKVMITLANKLARVAWVILNRPGALYLRGGKAIS